jgi:hypothetical protein
VGSIRHCSRSPFTAIAGAVLYGRAASRRPGQAFRLNPNSGPVCPACDVGVALFAGLFCICEWPILASTRPRVLDTRDGRLGHFAVPVMEHRILPESSMLVENTRVAVAGAEFHYEQICTGRAALMRPFLIPALAAGNGIRTAKARHLG